MIRHLKRTLIVTFILLAIAMAAPAYAQSTNVIVSEGSASTMDLPTSNDSASMDSTDYPVINMTQDKSEMVKLSQKAASVIVGNPNHISVMLDTPDTLVIVPRAPGASFFSVVGEDGSVIMERHVIVGAPKEQYVRIRRSCNANSRNCQATSVYYCPDMCHEVQENTQTVKR